MDPISLATTVVAALAPYAVKGGEAVAAELGKKTVAGGAQVLKALWTRWRGNPDREARLKAFVEGAGGGSEELQLAIVAELASHPDFADTLSGLLANEVPKANIEQIAEDVENMTGVEVADMIRGDMTIKQDARRVKNLTGLRVGTFGTPSKKTYSDPDR
jgi:hypothetical protein